MSVPVKNIPIGLKNVVTSFEGVSESSELHLSSITLLPGSQPDPTAVFVRNWNFNIAGKIVSTGISSFSIVMDLSEVVPSYVIDFSGALYGTLQIGSHLYASDKHIVLVPDNEKKQITLVVSFECPRKSFVFSINSTISDGGTSSVTWTNNGIQAYWSDCAMSDNGQYQVAVANYTVYVSSDSGSAWSSTFTTTENISGLVISSSGKYMYISTPDGNSIYISSDYGQTWKVLSSTASPAAYYSLACSSDGTSSLYAIIFSSSGATQIIKFNSISGTSATSYAYLPTLTNIGGYNSIACSADGKTLVACAQLTTQVFGVYIYSNGAWTTSLTMPSGYLCFVVAMSSTGSVMYTGGFTTTTNNGFLYQYQNNTWSLNTSLPNISKINSISCNTDGTQVLITTATTLYLSTDSGTTWVQQSPVGSNFTSCSINTNGKYLMAGDFSSGGDLWTGTISTTTTS